MASLKEPVTAFQEEKELAMEITVPEALTGLRVTTVTDKDGNTLSKTYRNADEIPEKQIIVNDKYRQIRYFNEDGSGVVEDIVYDYEYGAYIEYKWWPNGTEKEHFEVRADGVTSYFKTSEDGKMIINIETLPDGSYCEQTYYENGNMKTQINDWLGNHEETTYYENGEKKTLIRVYESGDYEEIYYDESGNKIKHTMDYADGRHAEFDE